MVKNPRIRYSVLIAALALCGCGARVPMKITNGNYFDYKGGLTIKYQCRTTLYAYACEEHKYRTSGPDSSVTLHFMGDVAKGTANISKDGTNNYFLRIGEDRKKFSFLNEKDSLVYRFYIDPTLRHGGIVKEKEFLKDGRVRVRLQEKTNFGTFFHEEIWDPQLGLVQYQTTDSSKPQNIVRYKLSSVGIDTGAAF